MNAGDEFLATIRVYYTGQTTCGGGREFEDVPHSNYSFDEGDFESLVPAPKLLPTRVGAVIKIETLDGNKPIIAVLRDDGQWVTNRAAALSTLDSTDIVGMRWIDIA